MNIKLFNRFHNRPSVPETLQVLAGAFMISFSAVFVKLAHAYHYGIKSPFTVIGTSIKIPQRDFPSPVFHKIV